MRILFESHKLITDIVHPLFRICAPSFEQAPPPLYDVLHMVNYVLDEFIEADKSWLWYFIRKFVKIVEFIKVFIILES